MNEPQARGELRLRDSFLVMAAEGLALPAGLVTVAVMTRELGAAGYGQFALAASVIASVQMSIMAVYSRTTVKLVAESDDWRQMAGPIVRFHLFTGIVSTLVLFACAPLVALVLRSGELTANLRLFSLDLLFFVCGHGVRSALIGGGRFQRRAGATAARWLARVVLIVVLVKSGFGIPGAIWGSIGAAFTELVVNAWRCGIPLRGGSALRYGVFLQRAAPLAAAAIPFRIFDSMDLLMLKGLGGTDAQAGVYAMAQNAMRIGGVLTVSLWPMLLSAVTNAIRAGRIGDAHRATQDAMLLVLGGLLTSSAIGGASDEIAAFIYGPEHRAAGTLIAILLPMSFAGVWTSLMVAALQGVERHRPAIVIGSAMCVCAALVYWVVIPRFGLLGAAVAALSISMAGSAAGAVLLHWETGASPPKLALGVSGAGYVLLTMLGRWWPVSTSWMPVKVAGLGLLAVSLLLLIPGVRARLKWKTV
ncbi:MAG: oligosaccharide flippase family protein [Bryobacterales bacterium]|nr:oligosaccharide flippase family protein [Bryobacterales bacterium]